MCVNCHFNGVLVTVLVIQTVVWHCFFYKRVRASDLPFKNSIIDNIYTG